MTNNKILGKLQEKYPDFKIFEFADLFTDCCDLARASEREANPPASESSEQPKEQPVAEDAEALRVAALSTPRVLELRRELETMIVDWGVGPEVAVAFRDTVLAYCHEYGESYASHTSARAVEAETIDLKKAVKELEWVLTSNGFVRCDIPACNCGSWHHRHGLAERWDEITHALSEVGVLDNSTGNRPLFAIRKLAEQRDGAVEAERQRLARLVEEKVKVSRELVEAASAPEVVEHNPLAVDDINYANLVLAAFTEVKVVIDAWLITK